jgi:AAA domain
MHAGLHVAANLAYAGREVLQGAVVYVTSEGVSGVKRRLVAMRQQLNLTGRGVPFYLVPAMPNLGTGNSGAKELSAVIRAAVPANVKVQWCLIDTVRRATPGKDENSTKEMSQFIENCGAISEEFGCTTTGVHHTPRSNTEHGAGTNALDGAMDCGWSCSRNGDEATITVAAMKDGEHGVSWDFSLVPDQVGISRYGKRIMGCGVKIERPPAPALSRPAKTGGPKSAPIALRAMQEAIEEVGVIPPASNHIPAKTKTVTEDQWRQYAYARGISTGEARARQMAFKAVPTHLVATQQVGSWMNQYWLMT